MSAPGGGGGGRASAPELRGAAAYCSWSGGKDCALALHEAVRHGAEPGLLLNMMTEGGERSRSHGLSRDLLVAQAAAVGLPITFGSATWDGYTEEFRRKAAEAAALGLRTGVFGDIDTESHREWVESVADATGSHAYLPLWQRDRAGLMRQLLREGFAAHIVAVRDGVLSPDLLGERIDEGVLRHFERAGVDLAGENGEYHSVVVGGPVFSGALEVAFGERLLRDGVWFVDAWPAP
jgi:uncharacterized protein (TIGR00290 family)